MFEPTINEFSEQKLTALFNFIVNCGYHINDALQIWDYILAVDLSGKHSEIKYAEIRIAWSLIKCGLLFNKKGFYWPDNPTSQYTSVSHALLHLIHEPFVIEEY